jgi:hypothetical protein
VGVSKGAVLHQHNYRSAPVLQPGLRLSGLVRWPAAAILLTTAE